MRRVKKAIEWKKTTIEREHIANRGELSKKVDKRVIERKPQKRITEREENPWKRENGYQQKETEDTKREPLKEGREAREREKLNVRKNLNKEI